MKILPTKKALKDAIDGARKKAPKVFMYNDTVYFRVKKMEKFTGGAKVKYVGYGYVVNKGGLLSIKYFLKDKVKGRIPLNPEQYRTSLIRITAFMESIYTRYADYEYMLFDDKDEFDRYFFVEELE